MAKRKVTSKAIAKTLGIHKNSVCLKLKGTSKFTVDEALEIKNNFFQDLPIEYLFKK